MHSSTTPLKNIFLFIILVVFIFAWMGFFGYVNSLVVSPPPFHAVWVWVAAIAGTAIPVVNLVNSPAVERSGLTVAACLLALGAWVGFVSLTYFTVPSVGPRWLFFAVWLAALTSTAIPFVQYLNKRFSHTLPPDDVMLRQAIWVGIFGASCAWLQLGRALNWASALLLAAALIAIEGFLILRDRSKRPFDDTPPPPKR